MGSLGQLSYIHQADEYDAHLGSMNGGDQVPD